jgi:hypothetical protein
MKGRAPPPKAVNVAEPLVIGFALAVPKNKNKATRVRNNFVNIMGDLLRRFFAEIYISPDKTFSQVPNSNQ